MQFEVKQDSLYTHRVFLENEKLDHVKSVVIEGKNREFSTITLGFTALNILFSGEACIRERGMCNVTIVGAHDESGIYYTLYVDGVRIPYRHYKLSILPRSVPMLEYEV